jgi:UDP-N-acetylmuramate--alanine ligase
MASVVLEKGGLDPTIVIGGRLKNIKSGAKLGKGDYLVAEADESDGSFLKLSPTITVVTNIDNDHLDYYGTIDNIKRAFVQHINSIPFYGTAILCSDDANVVEIMPQIRRPYRTYGFNSKADYTAKNISKKDSVTAFEVFKQGQTLGKISLKVPGNHNILNALAAVAVGVELDIPFEKITQALNEYAGVGRRIEIKGDKNGILVIDDYGHHPTEVKATIAAVKGNWVDRRLIVLFQPHRYSRTAHLYREFGKAFEQADIIKILDIYAASEEPVPGVSSKLIIDEINANGKNAEAFSGIEILAKELKAGDIVLTLGAGDVWKQGEELLKLI